MKKLLLLTLAAASMSVHAEDISTLVEGPGPVMTDVIRLPHDLSGPIAPATEQELPTPGLDDTQRNLRMGMAAWKNLYNSAETRTTIKNILADVREKFAPLFPEDVQAKVKTAIEKWKTTLEQSPEKIGDFIVSIRENTPVPAPENLREKINEFEDYFDMHYRTFIEKMTQQGYEKSSPELKTGTGIK